MRDVLRSNESGFTLLELIVGIALMTLLMTGIFAILSSSLKVQQYGFMQQSNYTEIRRAMNTISEELRNSTVTFPPADGTLSSRINFTNSSGNGAILLGSGEDANIIIIVRSTGTERIGKGQVQSLNFSRGSFTGGDVITIDISMRTQTNNVSSTISLRSAVWTGKI